MTPEPTSPRKSGFANPLLYSSFVLLCAALYVVYVFYSRHESERLFEQQTKAHQDAERRANDLRTVEQLGGSELAIRALYVSPSVIHPGESAQLCYDVANAARVELDPPVQAVWPSHSRCLDLRPKASTKYTLTITDAAGKTVSQSVELQVR